MSVLSVGNVAGLVSPCLLVLCTVSINWGVNLCRGFGSSVATEMPGDGWGVTSVAEFTACFRLDFTDVSTGSGANRRFGFSVDGSIVLLESFSLVLLLLVVVSTGSTAKRRLVFTKVSTGWGKNLLTAGDSDIWRLG